MIYAYIRVSTDKQTLENQRFEINRFAKQRDFQIDVWVEETVSGTRSAKDRKLGVLLKRIKKGDRKSTRLNSSHPLSSRMPSSA